MGKLPTTNHSMDRPARQETGAFAQTPLCLPYNDRDKASKANGQEVGILEISLTMVLWISSVTRKVPTHVCANGTAGTGAGCIAHRIPTLQCNAVPLKLRHFSRLSRYGAHAFSTRTAERAIPSSNARWGRTRASTRIPSKAPSKSRAMSFAGSPVDTSPRS